jgi:uncharacterized protein
VALATSAAPTYFSAAPFPTHRDGSYVDGGVWANCPALVALVEAAAILKQPLSNIDILSIGTTTTPFSISKNKNAGALKWNLGLLNLMFDTALIRAAAVPSASALLDQRDRSATMRIHHFVAQSHTPSNRCVRFVFGVAAASRNTRFQAAC